MDKLMKNKVVFDGRNLYELDVMREMGYTYYSIGREAVLCGHLTGTPIRVNN